ncbi:unnamed protein product [Effrenium voratum]|nr:unnamed protein product [Effrenium voratum]
MTSRRIRCQTRFVALFSERTLESSEFTPLQLDIIGDEVQMMYADEIWVAATFLKALQRFNDPALGSTWAKSARTAGWRLCEDPKVLQDTGEGTVVLLLKDTAEESVEDVLQGLRDRENLSRLIILPEDSLDDDSQRRLNARPVRLNGPWSTPQRVVIMNYLLDGIWSCSLQRPSREKSVCLVSGRLPMKCGKNGGWQENFARSRSSDQNERHRQEAATQATKAAAVAAANEAAAPKAALCSLLVISGSHELEGLGVRRRFIPYPTWRDENYNSFSTRSGHDDPELNHPTGKWGEEDRGSQNTSKTVAGDVLQKLLQQRKVRRDELVVATKVGNVLGKQLAFAQGVPNMTKINDSLYHCISPEWIEQELTRSLQRLQLSCIDCLLLHCPEYECKGDVAMTEVYARLRTAFQHLEQEVQKGRIAMYGLSAAFMPLRPTDPQHLDLAQVMKQLPPQHHFKVLQFPLNFAEAEAMWVGHVTRNPDGSAVDASGAVEAPTLFEAAKAHGLATLINRPLDGIYKEAHGVLRFSSLDCDVRSYSELQLDNCDALEEKITNMCQLSSPPHNADEGAAGSLAAKSVKVLASLPNVDCVLLGMRQPMYVVGTLPLLHGSPPVDSQVALTTLRAAHNTICMWYATAIHESDHGTSKHWRLPVRDALNAWGQTTYVQNQDKYSENAIGA